jgi:hypothetical protein
VPGDAGVGFSGLDRELPRPAYVFDSYPDAVSMLAALNGCRVAGRKLFWKSG